MINGHTDRRLEVFIGATRRDLKEARIAVQEAVLESGHFPSGMELWNSDTTPVLETILRRLERCDVHILLIGARCGEFVDPQADEPQSFTEWEFHKSKELGKPVIIFHLDESSLADERAKVIANDPAERKREKAFQRFRDQSKSEQFCREFCNTEQGREKLGRLCVSALNELANSQHLDAVGWVRVESEDAVRAKAIRDNRFLSRVIDRLRQFQILTERVQQHPLEKELAAEFFWHEMAGRIRRLGFQDLFFESGSSLAFVSEHFENAVLMDGDDIQKWNVRTNNVETLLQLLLHTDLNVHPFPPAAPDPQDKYGAIFPPEFRLLREPPPQRPRDLYTRAANSVWLTSEHDSVVRLRESLCQVQSNRDKGGLLILATTSGLDIDHTETDFRGPHVGSHPNMLFKRSIMTTGCPVVLFLDSQKFPQPFKIRGCFPVFGPDCTWTDARQRFPIAVCMAWVKGEIENDDDFDCRVPADLAHLNELGFDTNYANRETTGKHVVIAANDEFRKRFPAA